MMPAFSSARWAGTVPATWAAVGSDDLLFMAGGGHVTHPDGPAAGVASIRQAWAAARAGMTLEGACARGAGAARGPRFSAGLSVAAPAHPSYYADDFTGATDTLATA